MRREGVHGHIQAKEAWAVEYMWLQVTSLLNGPFQGSIDAVSTKLRMKRPTGTGRFINGAVFFERAAQADRAAVFDFKEVKRTRRPIFERVPTGKVGAWIFNSFG